MRAAAQAGITEDDVKEIVANQVARAKTGDQAALKFVFEQVLGGNELKGATFVQHNYHGVKAVKKAAEQQKRVPELQPAGVYSAPFEREAEDEEEDFDDEDV
jgi:hypothetical protein